MPTQANHRQERDLLAELGLQPVKVWPAKSVKVNLPCDDHSSLLYLGSGLIPSVVRRIAPDTGPTQNSDFMVAMCEFIDGKGPFEAMVSQATLFSNPFSRVNILPESLFTLAWRRSISALLSAQVASLRNTKTINGTNNSNLMLALLVPLKCLCGTIWLGLSYQLDSDRM